MTLQARIIIPRPLFEDLHHYLLKGEREEVAVLFAHQVRSSQGICLVITRGKPIPANEFLVHSFDEFAINSDFLVRQVKEARAFSESVLLAHSHPRDPNIPFFSSADHQGEEDLYALLRVRLPLRVHGALVFAPGGVSGRLIDLASGTTQNATIRVIGRRIHTCPVSWGGKPANADQAHARQVLLWGSHGQRLLRDATIGVIGAGGTGSVAAQQLIHLGVGHLIVIDPEKVATSNLARLVGARQQDVGHMAKVEVVKRMACEIDPSIQVRAIPEDVCQVKVLQELRNVDLLFLCTDSHYSRAVVNNLGVQYRIPVIDLGFKIEMNRRGDQIASAIGEVRLVVPSGYCLSCAGVLDANRIRSEKASSGERVANPDYFTDLDIPDPSVITLTSLIASQAVLIGLDMLIPTVKAIDPLDSY